MRGKIPATNQKVLHDIRQRGGCARPAPHDLWTAMQCHYWKPLKRSNGWCYPPLRGINIKVSQYGWRASIIRPMKLSHSHPPANNQFYLNHTYTHLQFLSLSPNQKQILDVADAVWLWFLNTMDMAAPERGGIVIASKLDVRLTCAHLSVGTDVLKLTLYRNWYYNWRINIGGLFVWRIGRVLYLRWPRRCLYRVNY